MAWRLERAWLRCGAAVALALAAVLSLAVPGAAQVVVAIPDTTSPGGATVVLPVRLAGPAPDKIVAVEVSVAFDSEVLTYQGFSAAGGLAELWLADSVLVEGGATDTLKVLAATAQDSAAGPGELFQLSFQVADRREATTAQVALTYVLLNDGTPAATASGGSVTLTGVDGQIAATPDSVAQGESVQVLLVDGDENRTGAPDAVTVRVTNGAQLETLTALETGAETGQFALSVALVGSGSMPSGDGIVQVQSGDHLTACYDDVLTASGAAVERCDDFVVSGPSFGSDGSLDATIVLEPGDTVWVRIADEDLNSDGSAVEVAGAQVVNPTTGETANLELAESGDDTGVFLGYIRTEYGAVAGAPGDDVLLIQRGDSLRAEYADNATSSGNATTRAGIALCVDPLGDASGNGTVRGFDASLILDHSVGALTLTGLDSLSANVDLQAPAGPITAFDASLVLQHRVGLLGRFPVATRGAANHPQPETGAAPRPAGAPRLLALAAAGEGEWDLVLDERAGIVSADVLVVGLRGRAVSSPAAGSFLVASRQTPAGLRLALAAADGAAGPGPLVRLVSSAAGDSPRLAMARLNDGAVPAQLDGSLSAAATPRRFQLLPNHPNPFNPETVIRFEMARAGWVELDVLNPLGQRVRRLAGQWHGPGAYQVTWDGRDSAGRALSAGTYFCRLVTAESRAVRKMTLVK